MKLTEYIVRLQKLLNENGDCDVYSLQQEDYDAKYLPAAKPEFEEGAAVGLDERGSMIRRTGVFL
ncbi:hypothetical protein [Achromobacter phage shaaii_LB5]|nr:hypothetical protein [Achromobacter phage shaaii_LB5]